jgi:hypothetical protein
MPAGVRLRDMVTTFLGAEVLFALRPLLIYPKRYLTPLLSHLQVLPLLPLLLLLLL